MSAIADIPFQHGPDGWPLVRRLIDNVLAFFGAPREIMFGPLRPSNSYFLVRLKQTLALTLALARRLVLIEAYRITLRPFAARKAPPRKQKLPIITYVIQSEPVISFFTDKPRLKEDSQYWRTSLQLFPGHGMRADPPPRATDAKPPAFKETPRSQRSVLQRLAFRYEALRRIADNPTIYARRVARRRLTHPPRWLLKPLPTRSLGWHADLLRPAHRMALHVAIDSS